jgi:glycine cleavage system H protein
MNIPSDLKFTKSDEWVRLAGGEATMGISDYAQSQLSDIVYVEITAAKGAVLKTGEAVASVESVKAASEVFLPVAGTISAANEALAAKPDTLNSDPYGEGWMVKFTPANVKELETLMDAKAYAAYCSERESH